MAKWSIIGDALLGTRCVHFAGSRARARRFESGEVLGSLECSTSGPHAAADDSAPPGAVTQDDRKRKSLLVMSTDLRGATESVSSDREVEVDTVNETRPVRVRATAVVAAIGGSILAVACGDSSPSPGAGVTPTLETVVVSETHVSVGGLEEAFASADIVALATLVEVQPAYKLLRDESYASEQLEQENVGLVFELNEIYKGGPHAPQRVTVSWPAYHRRDGERVNRIVFDDVNVDLLGAEMQRFVVFLVGGVIEDSADRVFMFLALDVNAQVTAGGEVVPLRDGILNDSASAERLDSLMIELAAIAETS
jgi:hypothetical protein